MLCAISALIVALVKSIGGDDEDWAAMRGYRAARSLMPVRGGMNGAGGSRARNLLSFYGRGGAIHPARYPISLNNSRIVPIRISGLFVPVLLFAQRERGPFPFACAVAGGKCSVAAPALYRHAQRQKAAPDRMGPNCFVLFHRWVRPAMDALVLVKPETVRRWHRMGFRLLWRWKSRSRGGRPRKGANWSS